MDQESIAVRNECNQNNSNCGTFSPAIPHAVKDRYPSPKFKKLFKFGGTQHRLQK